MKESFRGVKMFKNKIVSSIKEFAIDLRSDIHPVLFFKCVILDREHLILPTTPLINTIDAKINSKASSFAIIANR